MLKKKEYANGKISRVRIELIKNKLREHMNNDSFNILDLSVLLNTHKGTLCRILYCKAKTLRLREQTVNEICKNLGIEIEQVVMQSKSSPKVLVRTAMPTDRSKRIYTSKYHGVSWSKKDRKYRVSIQADGKSIHIGSFDDEKEAALAYNQAILTHYPDANRLNKIAKHNDQYVEDSWPEWISW